MPVGYLSNDTTVLSNLSLNDGTLSALTITGVNSATVGTVSATTVKTSALTVGAGAALTLFTKGTVSIVTMTVTGNKSATTTATISGLSTVDCIIIGIPSSGLSDGATIQAWPNAANTVTVQFSNVSGTQYVQAGPVSYPYIIVR